MKLFSWSKFDESCCNYHMILVHSKALSVLKSGAKKERQNNLRLFSRFGH